MKTRIIQAEYIKLGQSRKTVHFSFVGFFKVVLCKISDLKVEDLLYHKQMPERWVCGETLSQHTTHKLGCLKMLPIGFLWHQPMSLVLSALPHTFPLPAVLKAPVLWGVNTGEAPVLKGQLRRNLGPWATAEHNGGKQSPRAMQGLTWPRAGGTFCLSLGSRVTLQAHRTTIKWQLGPKTSKLKSFSQNSGSTTSVDNKQMLKTVSPNLLY